MEPRFRKLILEAIRQRLERHVNPAAVADAIRVVVRSKAFDGVLALEQVSAPTLVVASSDELDPEHPYEVARLYAEHIEGAELVSEEPGRVAPGMARGSPLARDRRLPEAQRPRPGGCLSLAIQSGLRPSDASRLAERMFCPEPTVPCEPMFYRPNSQHLKAQLEERLRTALEFATLGAYELRARPAPS